ncbi:MAG: hypothetical protein R2726_10425 [Acidimicrobiales bacterium]
MKLRTRLAATALAAGSLLGTTGAFVGTAHAATPDGAPKLPGTVKIDPCVLSPDLCKPKLPTDPKLPKFPPVDICKIAPDLCKPTPPADPKDPGKPPTDPKDPGKPPTTTPDPKPGDTQVDDVVVVNVDAPVKGNPTFTG